MATAPSRTWTGAAAVVGAALLWSTTGTTSALRPASADPLTVAAARIVLGGALLVVWAGARGRLLPVLRLRAQAGVLASGALAVAVYQLSFFTAVDRTGVAVGTVVAIGSAPVLTGVLARLLHGAALSRRWALSTAVAVIGCAVLVLGGAAAGIDPVGVGLALVAGAAYAVYAVCASLVIRDGAPSTGVVAVLFGGAGLVLLPVLLVGGAGWVLTPAGAAVTLQLALLTVAVAYVLYGWGLRSVPVQSAATLSLAEPAGAAVLGLVVLHEPTRSTTVAGLALVGGALLLLSAGSRPRARVRASAG